QMFQRHGVEISRKTMGGWLPAVAELFDPLYRASKKLLFESKELHSHLQTECSRTLRLVSLMYSRASLRIL
ncbi:MAG: transposase, partial [Acidobacteria bacterium]|nr:transposase [Acidobacteriota bacterium]